MKPNALTRLFHGWARKACDLPIHRHGRGVKSSISHDAQIPRKLLNRHIRCLWTVLKLFGNIPVSTA